MKLEAHVDEKAYGRAAAEEENGVFTEHGYLTEREGFKELYRGPEDITAEYRVFAKPEPKQYFEAETGNFSKPEQKQSVLQRIAEARERQRGTDENREKSAHDRPKSHGPEL